MILTCGSKRLPDKKRVLLISYYFPPCGMGGVQRAVKFAQYLPEYGWDVTVLTVKEIAYYGKDYSLLDALRDTDIQRTESLDPLRLSFLVSGRGGKHDKKPGSGRRMRLFRLIDRRLFIPDSKVLWNIFACFRGNAIIRNNDIRAILSTAPPFSSHLLALRLARKFKLPWIADFRDGWTNNDFLPLTGGFYRKMHHLQERRVARHADRILCISERIRSHLDTYEMTDKKKCILLYNGFDSRDFSSGSTDRDKFTMTYMGTVTEWADPSVMFAAIRTALQKEPGLAEYVNIRIVGTVFSSAFSTQLHEYGLDGYATVTGYLNHRDALIELMKSSILLFAVTAYHSTGIITGKIFEYLASGKPVLAHTPHGEAHDLLTRYSRNTFFHEHGQDDAAADFIVARFHEWQAGDSAPETSTIETRERDRLRQFSRKYQAQQVAGLLDSLLKEQRGADLCQ